MRTVIFVNIVNRMNDLSNPKDNNCWAQKSPKISQFSEKGLYANDDDQDWGSSGMNDIQKDSE